MRVHNVSEFRTKLRRYFFVSLSCVLLVTNSCNRPTPQSTKPEQPKKKIGLVLAVGGLGDNSVNDSAYAGLQQAAKKYDIEPLHVEPREAAEFPDHLRRFANTGCDLIFGIGFSMKPPMEAVAKEFPDKMFVIVDVPAEGQNVVSLVFREHEGAYLAGALAAMVSKSKRIGFIGGMDIPLMRKWQRGFEAGARQINPAMQVDTRFVSVTVQGFGDPIKAKEVALSMYAAGTDVILQVTGGSAPGVYNAAKETKKFAIGSDQNQDNAAPSLVLTSVMRNLENLVVAAVDLRQKNELKGGVLSFGFKEGGIQLTDFQYTREIIGAENLQKLQQLREEIIAGRINVPDYTATAKAAGQ